MTSTLAPFRATQFPSAAMRIERRVDGTLIVTPELALAPYCCNLPGELARRAALHPDRPYLAERPQGADSPWRRASYAEVNDRTRAVAAWLLSRAIPSGHSLLILSGNSIAHAIIKYGAMAARLPACPVSVNYSLMGEDFGRLRHVVALVRPAIVFAEHSARYQRALETVDFGDATVITDEPTKISKLVGTGGLVATAEVLATPADAAVDASIAAIDPDEPTLYMLTSGSTSLPKAVIQTPRMIGSNLEQGRQVLGETAGWSDVMIDWLPWSHVSGAVTKMATLISGGTLYIDGGKPAPGLFDESLRNIKEIMPRFYINVPFGYAMLVEALEKDVALRQCFFRNLRLALYGGAGLPQALYDRFQALAVDTVGERIFFTTGYGATETAAGCMSIYFPTEEVGIGLPMPGLTLKLIPNADRYEVRLKGPMVTPGYLGQDSSRHEIFDDEGFYCTGDAAQWHDPAEIGKGLKFAGRLTEEFKLSTGTWVRAGRLRTLLLEACAPLLSDLLLCGENRDRLAILAWPRVAIDEALRSELSRRLNVFNGGRGSSERISAMGLLRDPPRADMHELSDKGTINQRVALTRRSVAVEQLFAVDPGGTATPVIIV
jgi:feruloyl-CoA synthase